VRPRPRVRWPFERDSAAPGVSYDATHPEATRIWAAIDVASLNTARARRDTDLRSPLFFDVEKHPQTRSRGFDPYD
jgi:polyisoprenoid-binding protein YceI